ncbi:MAG: ComEC/Rec2 family competence protein [Clostridiales bacterium]|nr:ComEC/Rec2 family competence protein [Clostridiales bacterium]
MKRLFNFRIMPLCLLGIVLAICVVTFCDVPLAIVFAVAALVLGAAAIFVKRFCKARAKLTVLCFVFLLAMGITSLAHVRVENAKIYASDCIVEGSVSMMTDSDEDGNFVNTNSSVAYVYIEDVKVNGSKIKGEAQVCFSSKQLADGLRIGDRIKFKGNISPKNLCVTDSYSIYAYKNNIYHYVTCSENPNDEEKVFQVIENKVKFGDKVRLKIKSAIYSNVKSETAGFLYAMTLGDKSGLDKEIKTDFQRTGVAHIFAVSGLHVGIIAGALLWLLKKLKVKKYYVKFIVVAAVLIPFCALCGFSASTVRATVMTLVALGARTLAYRSDSLSNLSLAGCAILLVNPLYLFDVGFLMSFVAVYGLITISAPIQKLFPKKMPRKLAFLLSATISVNVALLPIMIMTFGGQTLLSIVANLIVIPIVSIIFPIYLIVLVVVCILPFSGILLSIVGAPFTVMIALVGKLSELETPVIYFRSGAIFIVLSIVVMLLLSKYFFADKKIKKVTAVALAICLCLGVVTNITKWGNENAIVYCYEDKYDAQYAFVENADGGRYMIVNGRLTDDTVSSALNFINRKGFAKVDGIAVVGEDVNGNVLQKLAQNLNCSDIYAFNVDEFIDVSLYAKSFVIEDGLTLTYFNSGTLEIIAGKSVIRVIAEDYNSLDDNYDILISYDAQTSLKEGQYAVCKTGNENSLKNNLPSTFTFRLNNGKILINPSWRY